jgi:hypothetical protein
VAITHLSEVEGRSQAEILSSALAAYEASRSGRRHFVLAGAWEGDGTSIADITEEDLLHGFDLWRASQRLN